MKVRVEMKQCQCGLPGGCPLKKAVARDALSGSFLNMEMRSGREVLFIETKLRSSHSRGRAACCPRWWCSVCTSNSLSGQRSHLVHAGVNTHPAQHRIRWSGKQTWEGLPPPRPHREGVADPGLELDSQPRELLAVTAV